ncbi:MAG: hypothetical protein AAF629_10220 [Chloroflexota bacterium]
MIGTLSINQLAENCREEAERYRRTKKSDSRYCFELFRLALHQQLEAAWSVIVQQYQKLVLHWVHEYVGAADNIDEDPEMFANEAFTRMWQYGIKPKTANNLDSLAKCLSYLKRCVWSSIEDHRRWQQKDSLSRTVGLETVIERPTTQSSVSEQVEKTMTASELRQLLLDNLQTQAEHIVAEETWIYDQAPRQIYDRHQDFFSSVSDVSQTKRNILKRLRRKLAK